LTLAKITLSAHDAVDAAVMGDRRLWLGLAAAAVVVAASLRLFVATHAGSVWRDEANDIFLCRESSSVAAMLTRVESEGSPPLRGFSSSAAHWQSSGRLWPVRTGDRLRRSRCSR
jgi:hypothetical protein